MRKLVMAFLVAAVVACQQNPFPDNGLFRREPLAKPEIDRVSAGWSSYGIRCIEHASLTSHPMKIHNTDPVSADLEVEIFPELARKFVTWDSGQLEILSDASDVTGLHRFHVVATANHEHIMSSSSEEMFVYYVTDKNCPSDFISDELIRKGGI